MYKICSMCKQKKLLDKFYKIGNEHYNYFHSYCKECSNLRSRKDYAIDVNRPVNKYKKIEIINGQMCCCICNVWKQLDEFYKGINIYGYSYFCKNCSNERGKNNRLKLKKEFIEAYGGCCQCCGETEISFLTVEHMREFSKKLIYAAKYTLLSRLKRLGWPEGYTVLCFNCNLSTKEYGTICVHKIVNGIEV